MTAASTPIPEGQEPPPPLTWRLWLLAPVGMIGILGLAVPAWRVDLAPEPPSRGTAPAEEPGPRIPYGGELAPLLADPDLPREEQSAIRALHERMAAETREHGGIPPAAQRRVQEILRSRRR